MRMGLQRGFLIISAAWSALLLGGCPQPANPQDSTSDAGRPTAEKTSPSGPASTELVRPTVSVDPKIQPLQAQLQDGDAVRPLAAVADRTGEPVEFVQNELLLVTNDDVARDAFVRRWEGQLVSTYDPASHGLPGERVHLVRVNAALADVSALSDDLAHISPGVGGELRISSDAGAALLAAAAREMAAGTPVGVNFVLRSEGFRDRVVNEGASPGVGVEQIAGRDFDPNPYGWSYFRLGGTQNIGVAEAWSMLDWSGKLGNKVNVAVIDGGFWRNPDMPADWVHHTNSVWDVDPQRPNELDCNGTPCPWHGTNAALALAGRADNGYGAAGPAGPVIGRLTTVRLSGDVFNYIGAFGIAFSSGSRIVSMSFSARVPATLTPGLIPMDNACAAARAAGMLLFAAAGNNSEDIDEEDCVDLVLDKICWEAAWHTPVENRGVIGVGALAQDSRNLASYSNYGAEEMDICGPGSVWVGPDPMNNRVHVYNGTSAATPFVAGVAALVWSANPALRADDVERILMETATPSPDGRVKRYVNAFEAVRRALGNAAPELRNVRVERVGFTGRQVAMSCEASDVEDGTPTVTWTSNISGVLGTGLSLGRDDLPYGAHQITCTARDKGGLFTSVTQTMVIANSKPRVAIQDPTDGASYYVGQTVYLKAWSYDLEEGRALPDDRLAWSSNLAGALGSGSVLSKALTVAGAHRVTLTGRDAEGQSETSEITLYVQPAPPDGVPPSAYVLSVSQSELHYSPTGNYVEVSLVGVGQDVEDGPLTGNSIRWQLVGNEVTWSVPGDTAYGNSIRVWLYPTHFPADWTIRLTATDSSGKTGTYDAHGRIEVIR
ncbi:MAG: S8 family serine peptidase [Phycisphaerae bacterium]